MSCASSASGRNCPGDETTLFRPRWKMTKHANLPYAHIHQSFALPLSPFTLSLRTPHFQRIKYSSLNHRSKHGVKEAWRQRVSDKWTHVSDEGTHVVADNGIFDRFPPKYKCAKSVHHTHYRYFHSSPHSPSHLQPTLSGICPNRLQDGKAFTSLKTCRKAMRK